ncbi:MAG: acyl-ACP--UDP-N-acetylglucosamine O-acyltransferase [Phycisphaerae bacterium]|nr:acyl-ACP--UDP-N-acetylglucosamine O-acyltransferase [Phycisphaerae bacterium]
MSKISELAFVHSSAQIGNDVTIGPFCFIGPHVVIGEGCELMNHVTVDGHTTIGKKNIFFQNTVIGVAPQDLKYQGAPTRVIIGDNNVFRENCSVHRGTEIDRQETVIGNNNLFMVAVHIAHDCIIHNRTILSNQTQLAGHVIIEDGVVCSAMVGIHHFVTVGKNSYVGGLTPVRRDVPPFMKFDGDPNKVRCVNEMGVRRYGFSDEDVDAIKKAHRLIFRSTTKSIELTVKEMLTQKNLNEHVRYLCEFIAGSCQSRYGRACEVRRKDGEFQKQGRKPFEVRED